MSIRHCMAAVWSRLVSVNVEPVFYEKGMGDCTPVGEER
jgi:hypothetical protein